LKDSAAMEAYAGIDVCKRWLDIAIHPYGHCERFENTGKGLSPTSPIGPIMTI